MTAPQIPKDFNAFHFIDIRGIVLQRNLVFTDLLGFHQNTEFKARAAIYHISRFEDVYEKYLEVQPSQDAQIIFNVTHPLKEIVFFEYLAATASLLGCIDSLLQEVTCFHKLPLTPTREKGKKEVTLFNVIEHLKAQTPESKVLSSLLTLQDKEDRTTEWFRFLRDLRNTALHADLYSNSHEARNLPKIMDTLDKKQAASLLRSKDDIQQAMKRDIVFKLNAQDYYMHGPIQYLAKATLDYVDSVYKLF